MFNFLGKAVFGAVAGFVVMRVLQDTKIVDRAAAAGLGFLDQSLAKAAENPTLGPEERVKLTTLRMSIQEMAKNAARNGGTAT